MGVWLAKNKDRCDLFSKKDVVFITKDNHIKLTKRCDVILSPEFYWVLRKKLPVKTVRQARKLCNSIFDDILPNGKYIFKVVKDGAYFLLFAYDTSFILKNLEKIGIDTNMISQVYFAQNELSGDIVYSIKDKIFVNNDGIFALMPKNLFDGNAQNIDNIKFEKLSNIVFPIDKYNLLIDKKSLNFIIIALMVYISCITFELFIYKSDLNKMTKFKQSLYAKYNLPSTSWQIASIEKKINKIDSDEIKLRKKIYKILTLKLKPGEYFTNLVFQKKSFKFTIKLNQAKRAEEIKKQLERYFTIMHAVVLDKDLKMELTYE